jgi:hypothetical protein
LRRHARLLAADRSAGTSAGGWTHFVKATFAKHSSTKRAPSASLCRSIFVTWLNGMPYDAHDSPFLAEMKVSAAEYQTHSLAIANSHYDKDAASEAKLRHLVDFCDAYAHWQGAAAAAATAGASPAEPADNVDSDDEEFIVSSGSSGSSSGSSGSSSGSSKPLHAGGAGSPPPMHAGGAGSPPPMDLKQQQPQHKRQQRRVESKRTAADNALSDSSDDDDDDHEAKLRADSDDDDCGAAVQDEQEYMPDRIVAKKTVRWQNFYLIHWLGYSEAERTWEPAAFFERAAALASVRTRFALRTTLTCT